MGGNGGEREAPSIPPSALSPLHCLPPAVPSSHLSVPLVSALREKRRITGRKKGKEKERRKDRKEKGRRKKRKGRRKDNNNHGHQNSDQSLHGALIQAWRCSKHFT